MKKKTIKIVAIVIACLFILGIVAPMLAMLAFAQPVDSVAEEYAEKQRSALAEMQELEKQMNQAGEAVYRLEREMEENQQALTAAEQELAQVEAQEAEQMTGFRERFQAVCENGPASYLEMILSAENFTDFIDRLVIAREIAEYDNSVLSSMEKIKGDIRTEKENMENLKAEQERNKAELEQAMAELYQKSEETARYLKELEADRAAYEQYLADKAEQERQAKLQAGISAADRPADLSRVSDGDFLWPTDTNKITSSFSPNRVNPVSGVVRPHTGTDIGAQQGAPIWAAQSGTVILAANNGGYGNCVILDHGNGVTTLYGHMSAILVQKGDVVQQGEQIGRVGSTGNSTGPHLHFEIMIDGVPVDAMQFF